MGNSSKKQELEKVISSWQSNLGLELSITRFLLSTNLPKEMEKHQMLNFSWSTFMDIDATMREIILDTIIKAIWSIMLQELV